MRDGSYNKLAAWHGREVLPTGPPHIIQRQCYNRLLMNNTAMYFTFGCADMVRGESGCQNSCLHSWSQTQQRLCHMFAHDLCLILVFRNHTTLRISLYWSRSVQINTTECIDVLLFVWVRLQSHRHPLQPFLVVARTYWITSNETWNKSSPTTTLHLSMQHAI